MKKQKALYNQIRGLITDVNINVNAGNPTFKNFTLTSIGKLEKRKGWSLIRSYDEGGKDVSNITIDYSRLNTGVTGYPRTTVFHCKPIGNKKNVLLHRIVDNENQLWRIEYDSTNTITKMIQIAGDYVYSTVKLYNNWIGNGNVKFIETPEQVYIVNDYKTTVSQNVLKYGYSKNLKANDIDIAYNVMINKGMPVEVSTKTGVNNFIISCKYRYLVLPVYNTGSFGSPVPLASNGGGGLNSYYSEVLTVTSSQVVVSIKIRPSHDSSILFYRIYRTKNMWTNPNDTSYYFVSQIARPDEAGLNNFYELTTDGIADDSLGDIYIPSIPINAYWESYILIYGALPFPSESIGAVNGLIASCGCYAQNRTFWGGNAAYPSLVLISDLDKTDSILADGYTMELANENNPVIAIEEVGNNIYVFCKSSLYVLRPTQDPDAPF